MFRQTFRRLLAVDDPPERTALAFAVGVFIAFTPLIGLHTIIATALALLCRFNKLAIYTGTFVNNPILTFVPITLGSYALGALLLRRPLRLPRSGLQLLAEPHLLTAAYWHELFQHSWDILLPFALGGMLLSVVCSLVAYPVTLRLIRARRARKAAQSG